MPASSLYIGLMSGTSADGVDAALVEFKSDKIQLIDFISPSLPKALKKSLLALNDSPHLSLEQFSQLSFDIALQFSQAAQMLMTKNRLQASDIHAIGSHGQTIYHAPHIPMSVQIGHPAFVAKTTGIQTVADFRVDDMALGGQGAPFAPAFHQVLFTDDQACFVVNIGGIANISFLPGNRTPNQPPLGYDTGPGNALMDDICQQFFDKAFDENGELAKQGKVDSELLTLLLSHPYFLKTHPKSTGRETFNESWLEETVHQHEQNLGTTIVKQTLLSTLCELTAHSIAMEIKKVTMEHLPIESTLKIPVWIVGGGAQNQHLISRLQNQLPHYHVQSSAAKQIDPNAIEAMMCAWLAQQRMALNTIPLSAVTGAKRDAVLGGLWLP
ncbi:anhydro-N-acetylmuramic acid kinase [Thiomicrorhabdus arctica]|jgi:anhydro-N-acetylmuramic acid kinase|uniref:anhydro-N-acetylmuramic acid kinase n=1 Tax=Thiomicrorhabdus arctica TaxID=131540 RepID=UPI00035F2E61|nr:anhydro-N-acetylmuramic acid kinase [Thiomicrorhabdus arctica]